NCAASPMLISNPLPTLVTQPTVAGLCAALMNACAVSSTNEKSRVGCSAPNRIDLLPLASCPMIVGITARADCLGPYVLNGRSTATGVPNEEWNESARWSAAILVAE